MRGCSDHARARRKARPVSWPRSNPLCEGADHVIGPGVVAEPLLVADDLLAVGKLERQPGRGLTALGANPQPRPFPGCGLVLDRDPTAARLVLEGVELVGGHSEHELTRQATGLPLSDL